MMSLSLKGKAKHMDVTMNEAPIKVPKEVVTWGDLLDWLETRHLKAGECITHVYLGGRETLNYRDRLTCEQELGVVGNITVQSGDFDTVVRESLEELNRELNDVLASADEIVCLLKNECEEQACNQLDQVLDSIRIFFTIFAEDLGWNELSDMEVPRREVPMVLERVSAQLSAARASHHWDSVCDVLKYEITPILQSWQKLVERTRVQPN